MLQKIVVEKQWPLGEHLIFWYEPTSGAESK
jgi:hypothetical protein